WQLLNPAAGCQGLPSATLNAGQISQGTIYQDRARTIPLIAPPSTVCQEDLQKNYFMYSPSITRKGLNFHATVNITPDIQAYAMANWYETSTASQVSPLRLDNLQTAAGGPLATVSRIYLPAYVCPTATPVFAGTSVYFTGCDATNGTLNPNNPFAAQGDMARLSERGLQARTSLTDANTYRFSGGV